LEYNYTAEKTIDENRKLLDKILSVIELYIYDKSNKIKNKIIRIINSLLDVNKNTTVEVEVLIATINNILEEAKYYTKDSNKIAIINRLQDEILEHPDYHYDKYWIFEKAENFDNMLNKQIKTIMEEL